MGDGTTTPPTEPPKAVVPGERRGGWRERMRTLRTLGPAGVLYVASLVVPPVGVAVLLSQLDRVAEPLRSYAWGPVVCVIGFAVLGGLALLPTAFLAVFAGWAFGFVVGFPVAVAGFTAASVVGYFFARRVCGEHALQVVATKPKWKIVYAVLLGRSDLRTFGLIALLRVPSMPPFAMTSFLLASLRVHLRPFAVGTLVGVIPRTAAYVALASKAENLRDYNESWGMFAVWAVVTLAVLGGITWWARRKLAQIAQHPLPPVLIEPTAV